jgi:predicted PurR-regulated permease PerM
VVVVAGMKAASSILVPFLLAAFIAIICAPLMLWLQQKKVPAGIAVLVVVLLLLVTLSLVALFVGTSLTNFTESIPEYQARLAEQTTDLRSWLADRGINVSAEILRNQFNTGRLMQMVGNMLTSMTGALANLFMILLTVVFILLEASGLPAKIRKAIGDPGASLGPYREFLESVNRYLVIKTIVSFMTGLTAFAWLTFLDIDFPLLWGFVAFLLNYVPNIGSIIASVPAILLGLVQYGPGSALLVAAGYFAVNTLYGSIIEPRFMGKGLGLSTLVVFVSLVFWGWVLGPVGMLLSVLLTMIVKIALESRDETRWIAVLLGSTPTESS